jgi:hypothetical protein
MGRLETLRVIDPVLTNLARGYSNNEFIGSKLFPTIKVADEGGKIPKFGKENFKVYQTKRAIKGASNQIDIDGFELLSYNTTEHDLSISIDYRELKASKLLDLQANAQKKAMAHLELEKEMLIAELAQNDALYPSTNKEILVTNQFNDSGVDPVAIIEEKKSALRGLIGKRPNAMFMGATVFDALKNHTAITDRIKYSSLGVGSLDLLKQVFGIPNIFVGESIWSSDGTTFTDIWQDNIILVYLANTTGIGASAYEPSFGYTFQVEGNPMVDTYETQGGKIHNVRATDNYDVKIVGIESAYLLKDVLG